MWDRSPPAALVTPDYGAKRLISSDGGVSTLLRQGSAERPGPFEPVSHREGVRARSARISKRAAKSANWPRLCGDKRPVNRIPDCEGACEQQGDDRHAEHCHPDDEERRANLFTNSRYDL